ncbi:MAG: hypothetical protein ACC742_04435 [Thermoanaerobaculales bacterium]
MTASCPWCLEPLPARLAEPFCPHCGRSLGEDAELKALDLRFQTVEAVQCSNFKALLMWGVPVTAVIAVAMPFVHLGAVAVVPLLVALHLAVARITLARRAQRLLRPVRRLLGRWLSRFAFLWIGIPGYGSMTVPVVGVLTGVATFVALTSIVQLSTQWSVVRERAGRPLVWWETAIPVVLGVLSLGLLAALAAIAVALGWSLAALMEWVAAR